MTNAKHTPGPWAIFGSDQVITHPDYSESPNNQYKSIADVHALDVGAEERHANARLIAASPTLYDYAIKQAKAGDKEAQSMLDLLQLCN